MNINLTDRAIFGQYQPHNPDRNSGESFDIRDHIDKLDRAKEKGRYICPVCNGHNLTVNRSTGAYKCWNGCECKDIRDAIAPLPEKEHRTYIRSKPKSPKLKPVPLPEGLEIVRIGEVDIPKPLHPDFISSSIIKRLESKGCTPNELSQVRETKYPYGGGKFVHRYECPCAKSNKGRAKTFSQSHIREDGQLVYQKGDEPWTAYCLDELVLASKSISTPLLMLQEGEECVNIARAEGCGSFTFQGSGWDRDLIEGELSRTKDELPNGFAIAFLHDPDDAGVKKAETVGECCNRLKIPFLAINPRRICDNLPDKSDIKEILQHMTMDEFINRLESEIHASIGAYDESIKETDSETDNYPLETLNQRAFDFFFGDKPWICADGILYEWMEGYYSQVKDGEIVQKIAAFCNNYAVYGESEKRVKYPFAKTTHAKEVLAWAKMLLTVDPDKLNPPGINCSNGILRVFWKGNKPEFKLLPHSPNEYYIYPGLVEYNPSAHSPHCDRLLECLDPAQRQIFLRNIAAAFDLPNARRIRGRAVRGLLPIGVGSNGKDGLHKAVELIFGKQGLTSKTLADFQQYDEGRKFGLAALRYSRINWASENPQTIKLDRLQGLKAFITGQKLDAEKKGVDGEEFTPTAVGLWNLNELPNMEGALQSTRDRFAPLTFRYVYTDNPNPLIKYEVKADPRFVYDEDFQRFEVCPTFLNYMVQAFHDLIEHGIDYSCTHEAYLEIQIKNNHLFQFAQDVNLAYDPESQMAASDLWNLLEQWYQDEGILTIDRDGRRTWGETNRPSDRPVKAINQVLPAIHKLFPKASVRTTPHPSGKKSIPVITGIGIVKSNSPHPNSTPIPPQSPPQQTLINQDLHPTHPNFSTPQKQEKKEDRNPLQREEITDKERWSPETGVGGVRPSHSKDSGKIDWGGTGVENVETEVENTGNIRESSQIENEQLEMLQPHQNDAFDALNSIKSDSVINAVSVPEPITNIEIEQAKQSVLACRSKSEIKQVTANWDEPFRQQVRSRLTESERQYLGNLPDSCGNSADETPFFRVGDGQSPVSDHCEIVEEVEPVVLDIDAFELGMKVRFNREVAKPESAARIPENATTGQVVLVGFATIKVQWDGLEVAQYHKACDLQVLD